MISIIVPTCKTVEETEMFMVELTKNTSPLSEIIVARGNQSAAKNRNFGLSKAKGDIIIQVDDDISGFYPDWDLDLTWPFVDDKNFLLVSAELHKPGTPKSSLKGVTKLARNIIAGACMAHRRTHIRYDEAYLGSGVEDNDFCLQCHKSYLPVNVMINYDCKLFHDGQKKNNAENFDKNHQYYLDKWFYDKRKPKK